jgi:hypothetical protein
MKSKVRNAHAEEKPEEHAQAHALPHSHHMNALVFCTAPPTDANTAA